METREQVLLAKAREIAGREAIVNGSMTLVEALVTMGRWCDANPAERNKRTLSNENSTTSLMFDRDLRLEEKGLLWQIMESNSLRKPGHYVELRELYVTNPRHEPSEIEKIVDELVRRGYCFFPTKNNEQL